MNRPDQYAEGCASWINRGSDSGDGDDPQDCEGNDAWEDHGVGGFDSEIAGGAVWGVETDEEASGSDMLETRDVVLFIDGREIVALSSCKTFMVLEAGSRLLTRCFIGLPSSWFWLAPRSIPGGVFSSLI
jgi:hypothetical protein